MPHPSRDLVFVSYSHADTEWLKKLQVYMKPFVRQGSLAVWADTYIQVGDDWRREIGDALERAAVGLCLVSPDFAASDFIVNVEIPKLLEAAEQDQLTVFCVPALAVSAKALPMLAPYQWVRGPDQPLIQLSEADRNQALVEIVNKLVAAVEARVRLDAPAAPAVPPAAPKLHLDVPVPARAPVEPVAIPEDGQFGGLHGVPDLPLHHVPREEDLAHLKRELLGGTVGAVGITATKYRVGLHGQGGIGKSVLAAALAHDEEVRRAFPDGVFWTALGQTPDLLRLQAGLLQAVGGDSAAVTTEEEGRRALGEMLAGRAVLLVLDDVWDVSHARAFDGVGPRSRLLVTTRDGGILTALGAREMPIRSLPEAAALGLLASWAGQEAAHLPEAARGVARECGYLPLALAVAGARVRDGVPWEAVLQALENGHLEFLDHPYGNVFRSMRLSVDALPDEERKRYLELAVFPEDEQVPEPVVLGLWRQTGKLKPHDGIALATKLERKALLEIVRPAGGREIALHDLQHDFLRILADNLPALHQELLEAFASTLPDSGDGQPAWHLLPRDHAYPWLHLGEHLAAAGRSEEMRSLLVDYRWLEAKLGAAGLSALLSDFDAFTHDKDLSMVAAALRVSAHILAKSPDQLPSQLVGRLLGVDRPAGRSVLRTVQPAQSRLWLRPLTASLTPPGTGLIRTLEGPSSCVVSVSVSANGRHVISGLDDGTVKVWDLESGQKIRTLEGYPDWVMAMAASADGRLVVSGSFDHTVKVWDLESGQEIRMLEGHLDWVRSVAVSSDGRLVVSGSSDHTVKVWDLESGDLVVSFTADAPVLSCAVTPSGSMIVAGDQLGRVHFLRVEEANGESAG